MKILHLTLKKKWFDMILWGHKTEEYREIKPYWLVRFIKWGGMAKKVKIDMCESLKNEKSAGFWNFNNDYCNNIHYDIIRFTNGYSKDAPTFDVECKPITIGKGKKYMGAPHILGEVTPTFIISLGKIISTKNIKTAKL